MRCVFELGSANAMEVADHLAQRYGVNFSAKTVGVFLLRLEQRGFVKAAPVAVPRGRPYHSYTPAITKEVALLGQFQQFLKQYLVHEDGELKILRAAIEGIQARRERSSGGPPIP